MPLSAGTRLGPYEILAPIGAGGMGEVYKAKDTKLDREVAIKILPNALARDPERLARFEREAKVLASLNHPNIATIYAIEESPEGKAIAMELVPGQTLKGPLVIETALNYAKQIAEALEAAHEKGITHRDLKPANVLITPEGVVKVLDFGLASVPSREAGSDPQNSPTLTIAATQAGMIMGTAAYMSPEQAAGKPVDRRADIWSFGVVVWEMLTGKRLFEGETVSHTLADVLRRPVEFDKLPAETPATIRRLLRRCLDRDVKHRLQWIGEARIALNDAGKEPEPARQPRGVTMPWTVAVVFAIAAAASTWAWWRQPAPDVRSLRVSVEAPPDTHFTNPYFGTAVSPDGRLLVFTAARASAGAPTLWLRPMDSLTARELPGTDGGNGMFWSPDSKSIGFVADGKLKRVDVLGGSPQVLCDAPGFEGGSWNQDGAILFSSNGAIQRVSAAGGAPTAVTIPDTSRQETEHRSPYFLPDGKSFLFTIASANQSAQGIHVATLDAPKQRVRLAASNAKAVYAPPRGGRPGYLLWLRDLTLVAQRFDAGKTRVEGDPIPVAEDVAAANIGSGRRSAYWTSDTGLLLYRSGGGIGAQLNWVGRDGKREVVTAVGTDPQSGDPRISPDGARVALHRSISGAHNIWLYELARGVMTRLTFDPGNDTDPVWSPDARQIAFASDRGGTRQIYRKDSGGAGPEERLTDGPNPKVPMDWSRDGRYILYQQQDPKNGWDIWALPLQGDRKPVPVLQTPFNEQSPQFSPDGKWVAYESNESGADQVYIQSFPPSGGKWQVSTNGGQEPRWRGDGKEIYYYASERIWAAGVRTAAGRVEVDSPRGLFPDAFFPGPDYYYDVTRDGQRFLELQLPSALNDQSSNALIVVSNWQASLKQ